MARNIVISVAHQRSGEKLKISTSVSKTRHGIGAAWRQWRQQRHRVISVIGVMAACQ